MPDNMFFSESSYAFRKHLVQSTPEFLEVLTPKFAAAAVVNAADLCQLSCPHCLYAAAIVKRKKVAPAAIKMNEAEQFVKIMNEAQLEHLIFSGGGESYENLPVMCYMLENLKYLRQLVTVTSCYFATSSEQTEQVFNSLVAAIQRGNQKWNRSEVQFILRISFDNSHDVPLESILNAINYTLNHSPLGVNMQVVVRTLLDPKENKDLTLAEKIGGILLPFKDNDLPTSGMPVIDGFPTRWIQVANKSMPVIYKPTYFEGLAYKGKYSQVPGTTWQEIKAVEELGDNFFNLSLRGRNGEGHNYYETVLGGYEYWSKNLKGEMFYNTPKSQLDKGFSIYLPADGRLFINASSPDSYLPVTRVASWKEFLKIHEVDVLQYFVVSRPTDELVALAKEVEPEIDIIIDRRNFVFSLAYTSLETAALRLYLTIRLLQLYAEKNSVTFSDELVQEIVSIPKSKLAEMYKQSGQTLNTIDAKQSLFRDPIVGNERSIYEVD
jgi:organic radical activating enzyme